MFTRFICLNLNEQFLVLTKQSRYCIVSIKMKNILLLTKGTKSEVFISWFIMLGSHKIALLFFICVRQNRNVSIMPHDECRQWNFF